MKLLNMLTVVPSAGRIHQTVAPPIRLHPYQSHHVMYRERGNDIVILRIIHGRQNWSALLQD